MSDTQAPSKAYEQCGSACGEMRCILPKGHEGQRDDEWPEEQVPSKELLSQIWREYYDWEGSAAFKEIVGRELTAAYQAGMRAMVQHASDCAVHNEPALPNGPCNCGALAPDGTVPSRVPPEPSQTLDTRTEVACCAHGYPSELCRLCMRAEVERLQRELAAWTSQEPSAWLIEYSPDSDDEWLQETVDDEDAARRFAEAEPTAVVTGLVRVPRGAAHEPRADQDKMTVAEEFIRRCIDAVGRDPNVESVNLIELADQVIGCIEQYKQEAERAAQPPVDDLKEAVRLLHIVRAWFWRSSDEKDSARVDPLYPAGVARTSKAPLFAAITALLDRHPYGGATSTKEVRHE